MEIRWETEDKVKPSDDGEAKEPEPQEEEHLHAAALVRSWPEKENRVTFLDRIRAFTPSRQSAMSSRGK